ncbi:MAG: NAD(P)-binding domain-containing protein, partial [Prolixibacteraceae bacterium]
MKTAGIIGSGNVGKALAVGFIEKGYKTTLSSRSEKKRKALENEIENLET